MFQMEVDGSVDAEPDYESSDYDSSQQHAPRHSIPFGDRLRGYDGTGSPIAAQQRPATHSGQPQGQQGPPLGRDIQSDELHRQAQSQALKRMLMLQSDGPASSQGSPIGQPELRHARQISAPVELPAEQLEWPATAAHAGPQVNGYALQANGYASHQHGYSQRSGISPDVRSMEADLKRMLKLG